MLPLVAVVAMLSLVRLFSDELLARQIYGIGVMLLTVGLTIYALDSVVRLIGLGDDRLLLLSPLPRWRLATLSILILSAFLLLCYLATLLPLLKEPSINVAAHGVGLLSYAVSVLTGLGLMLFIVYVIKGFRRRASYVILAWTLFAVVVAGLVTACISALDRLANLDQWILGVSASDSAVNIYASILPIAVIGVSGGDGIVILLSLCNLALGALLWIAATLLARKATNYLRL